MAELLAGRTPRVGLDRLHSSGLPDCQLKFYLTSFMTRSKFGRARRWRVISTQDGPPPRALEAASRTVSALAGR